jgi:hypothetical protein
MRQSLLKRYAATASQWCNVAGLASLLVDQRITRQLTKTASEARQIAHSQVHHDDTQTQRRRQNPEPAHCRESIAACWKMCFLSALKELA